MHKLLVRLVWFLVKSLISTYRVEVKNSELREKAKKINPKGSFVFAVWHEQVVSVMTGHAWSEPYLALSSRSKDGDYAAYVSEKMGFVAVRGSSRRKNIDKGGKEALQEYIQKVNQGISGGMTVDGPRGPRQKCKPGVIIVAKETGAPVLPVAAFADRYWEFNSWDKFKIPKPFAKITMIYAEPILVNPEASPELIEEICHQVSTSLKQIELDHYGHSRPTL